MHVKERERNSKTFSSTPAWLHFFTNSSSVHTYGDLEERETHITHCCHLDVTFSFGVFPG